MGKIPKYENNTWIRPTAGSANLTKKKKLTPKKSVSLERQNMETKRRKKEKEKRKLQVTESFTVCWGVRRLA